MGGGEVVPVSDVNFDKYPSCLPWQVLDKNRGRMADRTEIFFIGHYIHYKTMSFLLNSVLYFSHNYHMAKEEKGE